MKQLALITAAILFLARPAVAQQSKNGSGPATYGPKDQTSYVINAWDFEDDGLAVTAQGGSGYRYLTVAGSLYAGVMLPNGARIIGIEIQGCDSSSLGAVEARLWSNRVDGGPLHSATDHGSVSSGAAAVFGCTYYEEQLDVVVDNFFRSYFIEVRTGVTGVTNNFQAVRLYYKLQVSPAPATATFADVPVGSPLHAFVEALVSAGITGGCGGGNYCPNQPLTRGQMAVFLAAALGLHWPN